jgi:hypothetical protein
MRAQRRYHAFAAQGLVSVYGHSGAHRVLSAAAWQHQAWARQILERWRDGAGDSGVEEGVGDGVPEVVVLPHAAGAGEHGLPATHAYKGPHVLRLQRDLEAEEEILDHVPCERVAVGDPMARCVCAFTSAGRSRISGPIGSIDLGAAWSAALYSPSVRTQTYAILSFSTLTSAGCTAPSTKHLAARNVYSVPIDVADDTSYPPILSPPVRHAADGARPARRATEPWKRVNAIRS